MMKGWLLWMLLSRLTGSPVFSALGVFGLLWLLDRTTVGILPRPLRALGRWRRASALQRALHTNPHDRRARYELADLWVGWGRYAAAVDVLKPNLEAGDDDVATLFLLGVAYLGAGDKARGELLLAEATKLDPDHQMGAIELERGRFRLKRGDFKGAIEALQRLREARPGTAEGRGAAGGGGRPGWRGWGRGADARGGLEGVRRRAFLPASARAAVGLAGTSQPAARLWGGTGGGPRPVRLAPLPAGALRVRLLPGGWFLRLG